MRLGVIVVVCRVEKRHVPACSLSARARSAEIMTVRPCSESVPSLVSASACIAAASDIEQPLSKRNRTRSRSRERTIICSSASSSAVSR